MSEGIIELKTPQYLSLTGIRYRGENYIIMNGFPDTSTYRNSVFLFKNSFANIEYAVEHFPKAEWIGDAKEVLKEYGDWKINEAMNILEKKSWDDNHEVEIQSDFNFKTIPFKHQLKCFHISRDRKVYGIFFEQGCGKTKVIIDTARYLFDQGEIERLIVIAPNGVHDNWITDELPIHMVGDWFGCAWRSSMNKTTKKYWDKLKECKTILTCLAFNVETFKSDKNKKELLDILKSSKCLLVIDESQKIKNPSAKRTKFLIQAGVFAGYKRILTGTPVTKGGEDFYSQLKFLDPNIIGISAFSGFKQRYCVMGGWEYKQIVSYRNVEELQKKVDDHSMRVLKKDCLDLPDKLYQMSPFDLLPEQKKLIDQIKKEGIVELDALKDKAMILEHVMTRLTKIQQISNGYLYDTPNDQFHDIIPVDKNPRLKLLKELINQTEEKVIIWTRYIPDIKYIKTILPKDSYVVYDGSVKIDQRKENKRLFIEDPSIKYFLVNLQAGHTGLTLTVSHNNYYYTPTYDLEHRLQSEDRTHRIGTKFNVLYNDLIALGTPEKKIINALKKKKSISDLILQDPASLFLEY